MTTTAPRDVLAAIPDEFLVPTFTARDREAQHSRLERLLIRVGYRPSYLDLHGEKVRRGLAKPLPNRHTSRSTTR